MSKTACSLSILAALLILIVVFWAGMAVGHKQAEFGYRWDKNYTTVFVDKNSPFAMRTGPTARMAPLDRGGFPNGTAGRIIAINLPTIAVVGPNNTERVIMVVTDTNIRKGRAAASSTDLRIGDVVTAIGSPDAEGRILATFIRVMPVMSTSTNSVPLR